MDYFRGVWFRRHTTQNWRRDTVLWAGPACALLLERGEKRRETVDQHTQTPRGGRGAGDTKERLMLVVLRRWRRPRWWWNCTKDASSRRRRRVGYEAEREREKNSAGAKTAKKLEGNRREMVWVSRSSSKPGEEVKATDRQRDRLTDRKGKEWGGCE